MAPPFNFNLFSRGPDVPKDESFVVAVVAAFGRSTKGQGINVELIQK